MGSFHQLLHRFQSHLPVFSSRLASYLVTTVFLSIPLNIEFPLPCRFSISLHNTTATSFPPYELSSTDKNGHMTRSSVHLASLTGRFHHPVLSTMKSEATKSVASDYTCTYLRFTLTNRMMGIPTTWRNLKPDIIAQFNVYSKPTRMTPLLHPLRKLQKILTANKKNLTMTSSFSLPQFRVAPLPSLRLQCGRPPLPSAFSVVPTFNCKQYKVIGSDVVDGCHCLSYVHEPSRINSEVYLSSVHDIRPRISVPRPCPSVRWDTDNLTDEQRSARFTCRSDVLQSSRRVLETLLSERNVHVDEDTDVCSLKAMLLNSLDLPIAPPHMWSVKSILYMRINVLCFDDHCKHYPTGVSPDLDEEKRGMISHINGVYGDSSATHGLCLPE